MAGREIDRALATLKQFFKLARSTNSLITATDNVGISDAIETLIGPSSPIATRLKTLSQLQNELHAARYDRVVIEKIWEVIKDLLSREVEEKDRHCVLNFVITLIRTQYEQLEMLRLAFYWYFKQHDIFHDLALVIEVMRALTRDGRDLETFEEDFGHYLAGLMEEGTGVGKRLELLELLHNMVQYNAPYLEADDIVRISRDLCMITSFVDDDQTVERSLTVMAAIVTHSELPHRACKEFIKALCRAVSRNKMPLKCWRIMQDLLGTRLGHSIMHTLCKLLEVHPDKAEEHLIGGAVHFIHMAMWSEQRVTTLKHTATNVLPFLRLATKCEHKRVYRAIMACVHRVVSSHGYDLLAAAWHTCLDIMDTVVKYVRSIDPTATEVTDDMLFDTAFKLHETITAMEQYIEMSQFYGPEERVFNLIERCYKVRPESSVLRLIAYKAQDIRPTRDDWIPKLIKMIEKFFDHDSRLNIRIKIIEVVSKTVADYRFSEEDELLELVVGPRFSNPELEPELCVRNALAQMLVGAVYRSEAKKCLDIMSIMEKLVNRPYGRHATPVRNEGDILDIKTVVTGLIRIFTHRMYLLPTSFAERAFKVLLSHMEHHVCNPHVLDFFHTVHIQIFQLIMKLRLSKTGHLGLEDEFGVQYSDYFIVHSISSLMPVHRVSPPLTFFKLAPIAKLIVGILKHEKDWRLIRIILRELPKVLLNKSIVAVNFCAEINHLADALCAMVHNENTQVPKTLKLPDDMSNRDIGEEFRSSIYPALAAACTYYNHMGPDQQKSLIWGLAKGVTPRNPAPCIQSLIVCSLEMRDTMCKALHSLLLELSKKSTTALLAVPILEFLSMLSAHPKMLKGLVHRDYLTVFASALPYTNPFKYNAFIVSLAYHVIATWYIKCRLPSKAFYIRYITAVLQSNAVSPFTESKVVEVVNEDSGSRRRSASLTERGSKTRDRLSRVNAGQKKALDEKLWNFHFELKETFIDLMVRYASILGPARPARKTYGQHILEGGHSQSWIIDHKIVTVTVSGCMLSPVTNHLCTHCRNKCLTHPEMLSPDVDKEDDTHQPKLRVPKVSVEEDLKPEDERNEGAYPPGTCTCWCRRWAELHIRRSVGDVSWIMRLENTPYGPWYSDDMKEMAALFKPVFDLPGPREPEFEPSRERESRERQEVEPAAGPSSASQAVPIPSTSRQSSRESDDTEEDSNDPNFPSMCTPSKPRPIMGGKSRNPVRRSNSSPEMSANWKNRFLKDTLIHEDASKARLSCEAIPEEMTPPDHVPHVHEVAARPDPRRHYLDRLGVGSEAGFRNPQGLEKIKNEAGGEQFRDRSSTIAVMSPIRRSRPEADTPATRTVSSPDQRHRPPPAIYSGYSPSAVFLMLFHNNNFGRTDRKPLLIPDTADYARGIRILDGIQPYEYHKVGVVYVGRGQVGNDAAILGNRAGSPRYDNFVHKLGQLINLKNADPKEDFLGGFDQSGPDGKYAYIWKDTITQVIFHVATLMPTKDSDPNCVGKRSHIGNDSVAIIYDESEQELPFLQWGQFTTTNIVVEPMEKSSHKVTLKRSDEIDKFGPSESKILSDENVGLYVRKLAIHANLASEVRTHRKTTTDCPFPSNFIARLRQIRKMEMQLLQSQNQIEDNDEPDARLLEEAFPKNDFTAYTCL